MKALKRFIFSLTALGMAYSAFAQNSELRSHCALVNPHSTDCDAYSTIHFITNDEPAGLSFVGFDLDVNNIEKVKKAPGIRMLFNGELLKTIDPADEEHVNFITPGLLVEDGTGEMEFTPVTTLFMVFSYYGDSDFSKFIRTGTYTLEIPDGVFSLNGSELKGFKMDFNYSAEMKEADMTYQLIPSETEVITDLSTFAAGGFSISFPNARTVHSASMNVATLKTPSGKEINFSHPRPEYRGLHFSLPAGTVFTETGTYVFTIAPGKISIDQPSYYEGGDVVPNFPGLTVAYEVSNSSVGVEEVDGASDVRVSVCSIDGKPLLENASRDCLKTLAPGLYIVNGKKVRLGD